MYECSKTMFVILILLILHWISCGQGIKVLTSKQKISRERRASFAVIGLLGEFTSRLKDNFDGKTITSTEGVVLEIFKALPVVGDIAALFHDDSKDFEQDVLDGLKELSVKLEELSTEIISIKDKITNIPHIIQISLIQKQVAEDAREINTCFIDYEKFLQNPSGSAEKYRILQCFDKIAYLRDIAGVLQGNVVTFENRPLFNEVINKRGYCNGSEIITIFKYIYGLFLKGCASMAMAERLKFNDSYLYLTECTTTNENIYSYLRNLYTSCLNMKLCGKSTEKILLTDILRSNTDVNSIHTELSTLLPWYYTIVTVAESLVFENPVQVTIAKFKVEEADLTLTVVLLPYHYGKYTSPVVTFQMKITECKQFFSGIDIVLDNQCSYSNSHYTHAKGYFTDKGTLPQLFNACSFNISAEVSDMPPPSEGVNYVLIGGIASSVVVIMSCAIVCCCKRKKKYIPDASSPVVRDAVKFRSNQAQLPSGIHLDYMKSMYRNPPALENQLLFKLYESTAYSTPSSSNPYDYPGISQAYTCTQNRSHSSPKTKKGGRERKKE